MELAVKFKPGWIDAKNTHLLVEFRALSRPFPYALTSQLWLGNCNLSSVSYVYRRTSRSRYEIIFIACSRNEPELNYPKV